MSPVPSSSILSRSATFSNFNRFRASCKEFDMSVLSGNVVCIEFAGRMYRVVRLMATLGLFDSSLFTSVYFGINGLFAVRARGTG